MKRLTTLVVASLAIGFVSTLAAQANNNGFPGNGNGRNAQGYFRRIATFPAVNNLCAPDAENDCFDQLAISEIITSSSDGTLLIYTDATNELVGFIDITDPQNPVAGGTLEVGGEPTSVAVLGNFALVAVNTSPSFVAPSGNLIVIDLTTRVIVDTKALGGQPDSIAISPDRQYAAIVIENERDEDLGDGEPPQLPGGELIRVTLTPAGSPAAWTLTHISLVGLADLFPSDPEPEFVDINQQNIAVVTLQENNHIVLVDLNTATVTGDFPAGTVNLTQIDTEEEDVINFNSSLSDVPREPDAVRWISNDAFATADEGDLFGGSRGFTIFNKVGTVLFSSQSSFEHLAGAIGHYPEARSENKGTEPEGIEYGKFGKEEYLFVGSERGSFVGVYSLKNNKPTFVQVLPSLVRPEGLHAIPSRGLFVTSSEDDADDDGVSDRTFRAGVTIYRLDDGEDDSDKDRGYGNDKNPIIYPTIVSKNAPDGTPVPWAALSGLGADPVDKNLAYGVSDSFFATGFLYPTDVSKAPAVITRRVAVDAANLDLEGVAVRSDRTVWVASEGNASGSRPNRLLAVNPNTGAVIGAPVLLPASVHARRTGNGFEGVAVTGTVGIDEKVYVAFQREWSGDPAQRVRIGVYDVSTATWGFLYYPLEAVASPNGGWVGLSEITSLGNGSFAVIERDNQYGNDARIKRIYRFSVNGVAPQSDCVGSPCAFDVVAKTLVRDLIPDLKATGGLVIEKVEGLAVTKDGRTLVDTDNDGVDGSSGETQFLDLGRNVLP